MDLEFNTYIDLEISLKEKESLIKSETQTSEIKKLTLERNGIAKSINSLNIGDAPDFIEEEIVLKAAELQGIDIENLTKGLTISNLRKVKRQYVNKQGTVYIKTVYIKKEEAPEAKSTRFLAQADAENNMRTGDLISGKFKGYNSGTEYETDKLKVREIHDDYIIAEFTDIFNTGNQNSFKYYPPSDSNFHADRHLVKLPRTNNKAWSPENSFKRRDEEPAAQVIDTPTEGSFEFAATTFIPITSTLDISVGETVAVKEGDEIKTGEITYLNESRGFVKVKYTDGTIARKVLSKISKITNAPIQGTPAIADSIPPRMLTIPAGETKIGKLTSAIVEEEKDKGVEFFADSEMASRINTSVVTGEEDYTDIFRGRPRVRTRSVYANYTDEQVAGEQARLDEKAFKKFNQNFGGFNFKEWREETLKAIDDSFGANASARAQLSIRIQSNGNMEMRVGHPKFTMKRSFSAGNLKTGGTGTKVYHALFEIRDNADRGSGLSKRMFRALHKQYINAGVDEVNVSAALSKGAYVWGRYGFRSEKSSASSIVRDFERKVGVSRQWDEGGRSVSYTVTDADAREARQRFDRFYAENPSDSLFPMNLLCTIGPKSKAGKSVMMGGSWDGSVNMRDAENKNDFENYLYRK